MKAYIVVANASDAYVFSSPNLRTTELHLLKEMHHPESREKSSELIAGKPGLYRGAQGTRSAYENEKTNPKKIEAKYFAKQLAEEIKTQVESHNFEQFILVAAAHFFGFIKEHLNCDPPNMTHISKDYTKLSSKELLSQLRKHLFT